MKNLGSAKSVVNVWGVRSLLRTYLRNYDVSGGAYGLKFMIRRKDLEYNTDNFMQIEGEDELLSHYQYVVTDPNLAQEVVNKIYNMPKIEEDFDNWVEYMNQNQEVLEQIVILLETTKDKLMEDVYLTDLLTKELLAVQAVTRKLQQWRGLIGGIKDDSKHKIVIEVIDKWLRKRTRITYNEVSTDVSPRMAVNWINEGATVDDIIHYKRAFVELLRQIK